MNPISDSALPQKSYIYKMTKSIYLIVIVCYTANLFIIQFTMALSTINLASILTSQVPCRYHLVFNNISNANLPTTRHIPVTLTKREIPDSFNIRDHQPSKIFSKLALFQNKGWFCEIVLLFVTTNYNTQFNPSAIRYGPKLLLFCT